MITGRCWSGGQRRQPAGRFLDAFQNQSQRYGTNGMLMDLTDRIAKSTVVNVANFPADLVALYTFSGRNYAIPKDLDTIALWYNKKIFDEAGVAYPNDNWTWDDLKAVAVKLTDPAKGRYGMDFRPGEPQTCWSNEVYQNGGYIISTDKKIRL
jgi:multiple sugar transport system substrate-binding protein